MRKDQIVHEVAMEIVTVRFGSVVGFRNKLDGDIEAKKKWMNAQQ